MADITLDKFDDFKENTQKSISEIEDDAKIAFLEAKEVASKHATKAEKEFVKAKGKTKYLSFNVEKKLNYTKKRIKRFLKEL